MVASIGRVFLLCLALAQLHTAVLSSTHHAPRSGNLTDHLPVPFLCHPDQAKALLQFKKSFDLLWLFHHHAFVMARRHRLLSLGRHWL
ncbi:hypothetical protein BDA96_07G034100 [Sorghum bicolor]|uniref:Secreted protein n=2 Tax=Sorghum bicolor TaxID=4558 RepID=A0A921QHT2_SORBI|nr:hypothetical protein BDA96_07G034100 [Sorghum bicolor]KXG24368.1 hypothetical protein SORBI_3007G032700 [Sorghum bicolor]